MRKWQLDAVQAVQIWLGRLPQGVGATCSASVRSVSLVSKELNAGRDHAMLILDCVRHGDRERCAEAVAGLAATGGEGVGDGE